LQAGQGGKPCRAGNVNHPTNKALFPQFPRPSGIGFQRAADSNSHIWWPNSFSACAPPHKTRSVTMNAEIVHITPTTEHRAKMAYVYIRQSSLMQVTRHAESTDLQYSLVERAVALGWPRERVELIDEDLGKSGAQAEARGGFQRLLAEISLARVGLV